MFRNYLTTALRNLVRNRLYAAINIVGLAVGFAAALLLALFVRHEFSYDTWLPGHERLYRVSAHAVLAGQKVHFDLMPIGAAALLKAEFPDIEDFTRFVEDSGQRSLRRGDIEFLEDIYWADPNLFEVLPLPLIAGDPKTAFQEPDSIVLTRAMARKYFGRDTPLGETIEVNRQTVMRVTAVMEDLPSNTHFDMPFLASSKSPLTPRHFRDPNMATAAALTYIRLTPGASGERIQNELAAFNARHPEFQKPEYPWFLEFVTPISDIHLVQGNKTSASVMKPSGSLATVYGAALIAVIIAVIAGINFVNLTTARAVRRAVEVGVRKTSGALRLHLVVQFIGEAVLFAALGMVIAMVGVELMLPALNGFLDRGIRVEWVSDPFLLAVVCGATLSLGILAGLYPAFILARFRPAAVLKGNLMGLLQGGRLRLVLVATQFAVLIVLALVSTAIYRQAGYAMNEGLRFDKDQVLSISNTLCNSPFANEARALPGVQVSACSGFPIFRQGFPADILASNDVKATGGETVVDFGYFEMLGLKPLAGRLFSAEFGSDAVPAERKADIPSAVVVNESLALALGFSRLEDAVGQTIRWSPRSTNFLNPVAGLSQIVGVVPNYTQFRDGVRATTSPQIYWINQAGQRVLHVKLDGARTPETLAAINALWKRLGAPRPIVRSFVDQSIEELYRDITRMTQTMAIFAAVAVFIACIGLFGLAAFAAELRTKEMGVRKALGARTADIVRLMLWEFAKPVLWASLVAWPVSYFIMQRWLEGFADRVDMGLWTFPAATGLALSIAVLTVAGHALLVARAQPVAALRYE